MDLSAHPHVRARMRTGSHCSESTQSEISDAVSETEEEKTMKQMGLPTCFATTKTSHYENIRCTKVNYKPCPNVLDEQFLVFWKQYGKDMATKSFKEKYSDVLSESDSDYAPSDAAGDGLQTHQNNWTQLWVQHYNDSYRRNYEDFTASVADRIADKFRNLSIKRHADTEPGDEHHETSTPEACPPKTETPSSIVNTSTPSASSNLAGGSDDEPPDEIPVTLKRQCETHHVDSNKEDDAGEVCEPFAIAKQKRKRKAKAKPKSVTSDTNLDKYWCQRYRLFSRFNQGIELDEESWYSVTPERIAAHIARRCVKGSPAIIIDAFCGAGGNTIQFALAHPTIHVIGVDIDPEKIRLAQNNARVYEVDHRIDFICQDFMVLASTAKLKADVVFLSPPWGGPQYVGELRYSLNMMTPNGNDIVTTVQKFVTRNIAFLLPRNVIGAELMVLAGEGNAVEIEQNLLNKKVKTVTAYFGDLLKAEKS
ncbi:Trimethylguanosine synthase [Halotydeus destructor]|nr:Trimethylguanosine synthase [Halotydeus destructor]